MLARQTPSDFISFLDPAQSKGAVRRRKNTHRHVLYDDDMFRNADSSLVISVTAGAAVACKCGRMWVSQCCFLMEFIVFSSLGDEVPDADWNVFDEACKVPCLQIWSASLALICGSVFCISMRFFLFAIAFE